MGRWFRMLGLICMVLGLLTACRAGDDVVDFFESGFADEDNGSTDSSSLTTENLQGLWELDLDASSIDDDGEQNDLTTTNLTGTWNADSPLPAGFLSNFGSEIADANSLVITTTTFTFRTPDATDVDVVLNYTIASTTTLSFTPGTSNNNVQATLSNNGTTLTLIDSANIQGVFTFAGTRTLGITSYDLRITETSFLTTITRSNGGSSTETDTYDIIDDTTIELTRQSSGVRTEIEATLSSDNERLTLTFPVGSDREGTGIFDRR